MVLPTENSSPRSSKKPHLLKPCNNTSIDGSETPQNRSAPSPPELKFLSFSVSFNGWRFPNKNFKSWARKMAALHEPIWRKAGIFEAVTASTYKINPNTELVLGIAEKWCPDTKTFVFPWGETTITLEDVMLLLGFSVLGSPVFVTLDSSGEIIREKLEKEWKKVKKDKGNATQRTWKERFMDSGDELEHVAFLVLWLSYFVFPSRYYHIYGAILPIAVHLSSAETFKERTLIGDDNSFTTSGSMTNRTSEDGMKKYEDSINKRPKYMKRARENDEITMGCCHTQVPLDNDEVDGRLTIAQMMGPSKKKYSDVKNVEVDNNDSGPCQKLASTSYDGNETVPPSEIEKKNEATDETGSKAGKNVVSPPETRKTCDGELDASKSNADMINDGSKQPKCLLHEDGIIAGEKASSDEKLCGSEAAKEDDIVDDDIMINNNEPVSHQQHASGGTKGDETSRAYESVVLSPSDESNIHIAVAEGSQGHEQRCEENGEEEAGSKGGNNTVLSPFDENNFSDPPFGANDTVVSPRETRKTCHDELNVYESNEDIINDGSKEPDCLLHEDGSIAGEKTSSDENFCSSEAEKQEESNIHITVAVGEGNQGQGCLLHDNVLESDETLKSNEVNEKRNKDFGEGDDCNDSYGKKFQELKVEALSIKERILKAQETVTWLKKRRATKQREIAVARLV
ncbi:putative aminotransferase-like, plant mobile domain-containing protein [Arabidopsis thaliana]